MTIGILGATALAASGCGGGATFADKLRPPIPVNLTVYINDARVSVSPAHVGAGPVTLIVTNQARQAESLQIQPTDGSVAIQPALADTGPISPQANATVKLTLNPGDYAITTAHGGSTDASAAISPSIQAARLQIGAPRPNSDNVVLQP